LNVRFSTKANLWRLAMDARVAVAAMPVFAAFDTPGLDDETRLREFIYRLCRWALENPEMVGITNIECRHASWRLDYIVDGYLMPLIKRLDALMGSLARVRPLYPLSTQALMSMLVQGVGFYFASGPMLQRLGAAHEIAPSHVDAQVKTFADFILAGLLSSRDGTEAI
jgi:TetR/AcrR family transcriptional regulator